MVGLLRLARGYLLISVGHPVQGWEKLNGADRLKQLWFLKPTNALNSGNSDDAKWVALNIATNKCLDVDSSEQTCYRI